MRDKLEIIKKEKRERQKVKIEDIPKPITIGYLDKNNNVVIVNNIK